MPSVTRVGGGLYSEVQRIMGDDHVASTNFIAFHFTAMTKTNKFNGGNVDCKNNHGWGFLRISP